MPRLFTALELPHDVADELELLRGGVDGARWIDRDSYHLTLRFIGDVEGPVAAELQAALDSIGGFPFELTLKGINAFGGRKPRAIWAGVRQSDALMALQADHEAVCRRVGLPLEPRQYTPHVTLARLRNGRAASAGVQHFIARHGLYESRPFEVEEFVLLSARRSRGGGPYIAEEVYPLNVSM